MKAWSWLFVFLSLLAAGGSNTGEQLNSGSLVPLSTQLKSFITAEVSQATAATAQPAKLNPFFDAAARGDWFTVSNIFTVFRNQTNKSGDGIAWQSMVETWGVLGALNNGGEKYSAAFGHGIIQSIPSGSIYFGGTEYGRFLVTGMVEDHAAGKPFFVLSQNALGHADYLEYIRSMFGAKIYVPTAADLARYTREYQEDAVKRYQEHKLLPGEQVSTNGAGKFQTSSYMSAIQIYSLMARAVFDKNPEREFYVEESFPIEWMYPYLEPHGLIMRLDRQPLETISEDAVKADETYWTNYIRPMIGSWLSETTGVKEVANFAEKFYGGKDAAQFKGDPEFVAHSEAQKEFAKLRASIAGLYLWRFQHARDAAERGRMERAADFAFRQALALCPYSPEVVYRYINFLSMEGRMADAVNVASTGAKLSGGNEAMRQIAETLEKANQKSRPIISEKR